ncbi:hypothetical protein LguiB_021266 [Lonicera macranthoides]
MKAPGMRSYVLFDMNMLPHPLICLGMGFAFLGVAYYNHAKLQALKVKEAQKKAA